MGFQAFVDSLIKLVENMTWRKILILLGSGIVILFLFFTFNHSQEVFTLFLTSVYLQIGTAIMLAIGAIAAGLSKLFKFNESSSAGQINTLEKQVKYHQDEIEELKIKNKEWEVRFDELIDFLHIRKTDIYRGDNDD